MFKNFKSLIILIFVFQFKCIIMISMKDFQISLDAIRSGCAPQFKVTIEQLNNLRKGIFEENKELKCYTKCAAQMAGTLNKKGEVSVPKTLAQINMLLPDELKELARQSLDKCKDVQNNYQNSCDKVFYMSKCIYEYNPAVFKFP